MVKIFLALAPRLFPLFLGGRNRKFCFCFGRRVSKDGAFATEEEMKALIRVSVALNLSNCNLSSAPPLLLDPCQNNNASLNPSMIFQA